MASFAPQGQRDQIMLLVAVLGLAIGGAYWYFVYDPKSAELATLETRIEQLDAANQKAKAQLAKGTVEQLRLQTKGLRDNLDLMRTLIPAGNEVPALLDQISGAARRTGLQIGNFEPGALIEGEQFDTYRFKLSVQGSYHRIGELLASIGTLQRIVAPINLQLDAANANQVRSPKPGVQELVAQFEIQTYVVKTAPASGAPKS